MTVGMALQRIVFDRGMGPEFVSPQADHANAALHGPFSIYLDLVRFVAAMSVVLAHCRQNGLYEGYLPSLNTAHSAVIVFFVLSGYVIAASTMRPGETWQRFVAA